VSLQALANYPQDSLSLYYGGASVDAPGLTARSLALVDAAVLHVTRGKVNMSEVYTRSNMTMHCKNCSNKACRFEIRPLCARCFARDASMEQCVITSPVEIVPGRNTWASLVDIRISCVRCNFADFGLDEDGVPVDDEGREPQERHPAAIGFVCMEETTTMGEGKLKGCRHNPDKARMQHGGWARPR
jgi:hypothetical protein